MDFGSDFGNDLIWWSLLVHAYYQLGALHAPTGLTITLQFSHLFVGACVTVWGGLGTSQW